MDGPAVAEEQLMAVIEATGWERGARVKGCLATTGEEGRVAVTKSG